MPLTMSRLHQSLSTISNRFAFIDSIDKQADKQPYLSLMLVDVVRFSDVTTSFGMDIGDQFLLEIANRILLLFKGKVRLGRISGDVFGLVFEGKHTRTYMYNQYQHLVEHFKTPMYHQDHAFIADFNVGVVSITHGEFDLTRFVAKAEAALKQAKENQYENFHALDMSDKAETGRSLALKADLKRALNNNELELYLQPKVDLKSLKITGAECLLRWNHPLDGVLFPGPLIEAAESYNMITELAYWTLEEAFKLMNHLHNANIYITLSVNISPTQLYDNKLVPTLEKLHQQYNIPLNMLELELTEDVALSNSLMVKKQLAQLHLLGVSISVDDFGKGYSNLAYIRDLSIHGLKIDKTFVMELTNEPVNSAIIQAAQIIGKAKGCDVIAEGVETMPQLHILRDLGVVTGQGFLFSPAVPLLEFIALANQEILVGGSPLRQVLNN
jgi:diguanylate cyclase (GGDEF)-like protein